jgi:hypothetical protein
MGFVLFSKKTAVTSLNSINHLIESKEWVGLGHSDRGFEYYTRHVRVSASFCVVAYLQAFQPPPHPRPDQMSKTWQKILQKHQESEWAIKPKTHTNNFIFLCI